MATHRSEGRTVRTVLGSNGDQDDRRIHQVWHDPWDAPKEGKVNWAGDDYEEGETQMTNPEIW